MNTPRLPPSFPPHTCSHSTAVECLRAHTPSLSVAADQARWGRPSHDPKAANSPRQRSKYAHSERPRAEEPPVPTGWWPAAKPRRSHAYPPLSNPLASSGIAQAPSLASTTAAAAEAAPPRAK
eukprot:367815-Prymnesium_polylepis.1